MTLTLMTVPVLCLMSVTLEETGGKMGGCSGMLLQRPRDIPRVFRLLDTNSDGKLSLGLCPGRTSAS